MGETVVTTAVTAGTGSIPAIFQAASSTFSGIASMIGSVITTISGQPLLLVTCVGLPLAGVGIGLLCRLIRTRA